MIPIFQRQDYREITQEWFTKGYYQEALAAYENIYQTERDNLSEDDYRKEFYNLCTLEYTELWICRIKELCEWIKKML
jgi:hypothetical protein